MARYTDDQRVATLALLEANAGNYEKTARETGIDKKTLRTWAKSPLKDSPELPAIKQQLTGSFIEKAKQVREALLSRLLELAPEEKDMFKVAGAFKIANEAARLESGEATQRSEVRNVDEDPERARLARQASAALEREWEVSPGLN